MQCDIFGPILGFADCIKSGEFLALKGAKKGTGNGVLETNPHKYILSWRWGFGRCDIFAVEENSMESRG